MKQCTHILKKYCINDFVLLFGVLPIYFTHQEYLICDKCGLKIK